MLALYRRVLTGLRAGDIAADILIDEIHMLGTNVAELAEVTSVKDLEFFARIADYDPVPTLETCAAQSWPSSAPTTSTSQPRQASQPTKPRSPGRGTPTIGSSHFLVPTIGSSSQTRPAANHVALPASSNSSRRGWREPWTADRDRSQLRAWMHGCGLIAVGARALPVVRPIPVQGYADPRPG
jgi:hypothetical protein